MRSHREHPAEPTDLFGARRALRRVLRAPRCEALEARALLATIVEYPIPTPASDPQMIAAGADGNLWFTEQGGNNVARITPAGVVTEFPVPSSNSQPRGIVLGPDGNVWFTESNHDAVAKVTPGGVVTQYAAAAGGANLLAITSGPIGDVWVVGRKLSQTIKSMTPSGTVASYSTPTLSPTDTSNDIAVGPDGRLWYTVNSGGVADSLQAFDPTTDTITNYPLADASADPAGIASGSDGALWFVETNANKIGRITTSGAITEYSVPTASSQPTGIAAGPDGALWFTETAGNQIGRITTAGVITEYAIPTANSQPTGITTGPNSTVWFTEAGANQVGTIGVDPLTASGASITGHEFQSFTGTVATFTDADPNAAASQFTATINWGDGATTAGTVQADPGGGFDVVGTHLLGEETPAQTATITINDAGGATASATTAITIFEEIVTAAGRTLNASENAPYSGVVAGLGVTLVDSDPYPAYTAYTVTIDWGDGTVTAGTLVPVGNGGLVVPPFEGPRLTLNFTLNGTHAYAAPGTYTATATFRDADGATASAATTVIVADAPLSASAPPVAATEGQTFTGVVAHFTDADPGSAASQFVATIDWGDGATTAGTVVTSAGGGYDVTGTHTYAEEGSANISVAVRDNGGSTATTASRATIADAPLSSSGVPIAATEGQAFTGVVGHFTDAKPGSAASEFTATIDWGDGATTAGTVVANAGGGFDITGTHTYADEGSARIGVTVNDNGGSNTSAVASATVSDAPLSSTGLTIAAVEGQAVTGVLAEFADADPNGVTSEFTATVDWGDGATTAGTVSAVAGGFAVSGSHRYAEEGRFNVAVHVADAAGAVTTAGSLAVVADAPLTATVVALSTMEGQSFAGVVAHFDDADPKGTASQYAATIDWGDGTAATGTVLANRRGGFDVTGAHIYADDGSYRVSVALADPGGATATAAAAATVSDAPLAATGLALQATESQPFAGVVAHFTDGNPGGAAGDFTATIDWGDGATALGTVRSAPGGGFDVWGSHIYTDEGVYAVSVQVADIGGATAAAASPATVADAPLSAAAQPVAAVEGVPFSATLARFADADVNAVPSLFTATIDWGDGATTAGTVAASPAGGFVVNGSHSYTDEGRYNTVIRVADAGGATATVRGEVSVADAPLDLSPSAIAATEGQAFSGLVAYFGDANAGASASDFRATIDWGDGVTTAGTVIANPSGGFDVAGAHAYVATGRYRAVVRVDDQGGAADTGVAAAVVTDAPLTATGVAGTSTEKQPYSGVVAQFTDPNPHGAASDFAATIDWGDGTTAAGTIAPAPGSGFTVAGSHVYDDAGVYSAQVAIADVGGAEARAVATVHVADVSLAGSGQTVTPALGQAFTQPVATFQGGRPGVVAHDFTATVAWGDGQTTPAAVISAPDGTLEVVGTHTYQAPAEYPVQVTLITPEGETTVATGKAIVTAGRGGPLVVPDQAPGLPALAGAITPPSVVTTTTAQATGNGVANAPVLPALGPDSGVLQALGGAPTGPRSPAGPAGEAAGGEPALSVRDAGAWPAARAAVSRARGTLVAVTNTILNSLARLDWSGAGAVATPAAAAVPSPAIATATAAAAFQRDLLWSELDTMDRELAGAEVPTSVYMAVSSGLVLTVGYVCWTARGGYFLTTLLAATPLWRQLDPLAILDLHERRRQQGRRARPQDDADEERLRAILRPHSPPTAVPAGRRAGQDARR